MQVFAVLEMRADASADPLRDILETEERYLWGQVVADRVRSVWSLQDRVGGVALLEVEIPKRQRAWCVPCLRSWGVW